MNNITENDTVLFEEYFTRSADILPQLQTKYGKKVKILSQENMNRGILRFFRPPKIKVVGFVEHEKKQDNEDIVATLKTVVSEMLYSFKDTAHENSNASDATFEKFEGLKHAMSCLEKNGFSSAVIDDFQKTMLSKLYVHDLEDVSLMKQKLIAYLTKKIRFCDNNKEITKEKVLALIGPTGIGKSTCAMKLAVKFKREKKKSKNEDLNVGIISLDYFKIAAPDQIKKFSDVLGVEFYHCNTPSELNSILRKKNRPGFLLIDTAGKSPRNREEVMTYKNFLEKQRKKIEIYLVIAANISSVDIHALIEAYLVYNVSGVILTKFDETSVPGTCISACIEHDLPIAYISSGQNLLKSFHRAAHNEIIKHLHEIQSEPSIKKRKMNGTAA